MSNILPPIPTEPLGENYPWREWFTRLQQKVVTDSNITFAKGVSVIVTKSGTLGPGGPSAPYFPVTIGSSLLYGNGSGGFSNVVTGASIVFSGGNLSVAQATSSTFGTVKPDNSTITISGGVISATAYSPPSYTSAEILFGQGSTTVGQDSNFLWNATTGLLTKKGISSPTTGQANSEAFGYGASAHTSSVVVGASSTDTGGSSVVVGYGLANTGVNNIVIGTTIIRVGDNNVLIGQGIDAFNVSTSSILGTTNTIYAAGSMGVTIFGTSNSLDGTVGAGVSGNYCTLFGYSNTSVPASINGVIGCFGVGNTITHEGCCAFGANVTSQQNYELAWGGAGIAGTTNPVSLRLSGSQTGTESNMTRINCTWSGANSIVAYSAYAGATEQVGLTITAGTAVQVSAGGLFFPQQHATVGAPAYVKGAMYFDTTLNKLRIGGAAGWETVTSV